MLSGKGKSCLLWFLAFFGGSQLVASIAWQHFYPQLSDREYGYRLAHLRGKLGEKPHRRLVLVLGNSRTAMGFSPKALPWSEPASGPSPLIYNFSTLGAGPLKQLQLLRRLLANRIRPDWVFVEVWPIWFSEAFTTRDRQATARCLNLVDLPLIFRHFDNPWEVVEESWPELVLPCVGQRAPLIHSLGPGWLAYERMAPPVPFEDIAVRTLDDTGWLPLAKLSASEAEYLTRIQRVRQDISPQVFATIQFSGPSDRALRDLLGSCRKKGIAVALFTMPEASFFRDWYPPVIRQKFAAYLTGLGRDFGIPVIDTRDWVPDNYLADGFHLYRTGAENFTRLFGKVALQPLLEGRK